MFTTDDNGRYLPGGAPFSDSQNYYYFVAARDVLGRPGLPSAGTLVTIRDRLAPNPPRHVRVRSVATYNGTVRDQRFVIDWQPPELPPGETVSAWYVYRWRTPGEIPNKSKQLDPVTLKPERNLIAILPVGTREFTDNGTVAPPAWAIVDEPAPDAADKGKTYFYTVRAADGSVSANLSGNSAPAWGVLRDRIGPEGTSGSVQVSTFLPRVLFDSYAQVPREGFSKGELHLLLTCESTVARGLEWAEWFHYPSGFADPRVVLGRARFRKNPAGQLVAVLGKTMPIIPGEPTVFCRVGTTSGTISVLQITTPQLPGAERGKFILGKWNVDFVPGTVPGALAGWRHETTNPVTGETSDVTGSFTAPADAKEFRIYRRVDDGAQTLITQGQVPAAGPTTWADTAPLAASATVEYFLQTLDADSNAGPLVRQGEPLSVTAALPTPMLEPLASLAPLTNARLRVRWFCSTAGVERFEIWVARKSGSAPSSSGTGLSEDLATHPNVDAVVGETAGLDFSVFQTGLARLLSVGGSPEFSVELPVSASDTYSIVIRAVGVGDYPARAVGAFSNVESRAFSLRAAGLNQPVPWPDRPLPPRADFHPGIVATYVSSPYLAPWKGNLVRIGEYTDLVNDADSTVNPVDGTNAHNYFVNHPPGLLLYTNDAVAAAEPLEIVPGWILPVVLYRVQVSNNRFPTVPGDIVQVSPLMERIAYTDSQVTDPFVAILHKDHLGLSQTAPEFDHHIFLRDSQPVIKGARYKYLLVRFTPGREIERVIVTNEVTVPLQDFVVEPPPPHTP